METTATVPRAAMAHLLLMAGLYFCSGAFLMQLPRYVLKLGGSAQDAGWLIAVGLIPTLLLSAWVGDWVRRSGGRRPAQIGATIAALASLLMLTVHVLGPWIIAIRLLYAVGNTIMFVMLFTTAAMLVESPVQRAQIIGWLAVAIQLGNALGGLLGELAYQSGLTFYWISCTGIALCVAILGSWAPAPAAPAAPSLQPAAAASSPENPLNGWPIQLWALVAVGLAFAGLTQFMPTYIEYLGQSGRVAEPFAAAWFITPALLVVAAVRLIAGYFAARLLRPAVLMACHVLLLVTLLALPWIHSRTEAVILALIFGLSYGWLYPALSSLAFSRVAPDVRGRVSGRVVMAFEIGFRLGPIGLGTLITYAGYTTMFVGLAVTYVLVLMAGSLFALWGKVKYGYAG